MNVFQPGFFYIFRLRERQAVLLQEFFSRIFCIPIVHFFYVASLLFFSFNLNVFFIISFIIHYALQKSLSVFCNSGSLSVFCRNKRKMGCFSSRWKIIIVQSLIQYEPIRTEARSSSHYLVPVLFVPFALCYILPSLLEEWDQNVS